MKLAELKLIKCFVTWMPVKEEGGHTSKIPSLSGKPFDYCRYKEPGMLTDYATSRARLESNPLLGGIGACIPPGVLVLDLDKCRDPDTGTITPAALAIIEGCKSFAEVSPSGTGCHIWCTADLPAWYHKKKFMKDGQSIEVLVLGSFCTFTGNVIGEVGNLEDCTEYISALCSEAGVVVDVPQDAHHSPFNGFESNLRCQHSPGTCPYGLGAIERQVIEVRKVRKAPGRRDALYTAAVSLGHLVAGSGQVTEDQVYGALRPLGTLVGLDGRVCDYYIARGLERGARKPVYRDCEAKKVAPMKIPHSLKPKNKVVVNG